ncbi:hypothetical protein VPH35_069793 [Triticum aestivum]
MLASPFPPKTVSPPDQGKPLEASLLSGVISVYRMIDGLHKVWSSRTKIFLSSDKLLVIPHFDIDFLFSFTLLCALFLLLCFSFIFGGLVMFSVYLCKILAMRHPRKLVLAGCLSALTVMTALSASLGWVAPNLISRKWTHHITTLLFFVFGIWSLWEGFKEEGESEDLAELEAKLDADFKSNKGESKNKSKATEDTKKKQRPFLMQFFSPIFIKAFSITFFGEWGDKSQIATIGLAADENPFGVVIGGVIAQALCTTAAVMGGKSLASQISEKMVELSSGVLFLLFGIMSLLSGPEGQL